MAIVYYTDKYKELAKRQLRFEHELAGKTIAAIHMYSVFYPMLMLFTDGTFAAINGEGEYDGGVDIYIERDPINLTKVDEWFRRAELITDEELRAEMDEQNKVKFAEEDEEERKEFERLSAKFATKETHPNAGA